MKMKMRMMMKMNNNNNNNKKQHIMMMMMMTTMTTVMTPTTVTSVCSKEDARSKIDGELQLLTSLSTTRTTKNTGR